MDSLLQDIRSGVRAMRRSPGFTLVAVLIVAIGVGAASSVFAAMVALLLRPLPLPDAGRVVAFAEVVEGTQRSFFSYPQYLEYRNRAAGALDLAASAHTTLSVRTGPTAEARMAEFVTGNYFGVLEIAPALGRWITPADDVQGTEPVAVIGHALWQSQFGGGADALGRAIQVNGNSFTIVGVAGRDFTGTLLPTRTEVWVPVATYPVLVPRERDYFMGWDNLDWLVPFGRLASGVTRDHARAVLDAARTSIAADFPDDRVVTGVGIHRMTGIPVSFRSPVGWFLALLLATASLLLFVASVNVSGMLLARAPGRRREMAVRVAVGAGRARLIRMLVTESAVLFAAGAAGGVLIAIWTTAALRSVSTPLTGAIPVGVVISPDWRVFVFALTLAVGVGVAAGLAPALGISRPDLVPALKEGSGGSGRGRSRLRDATVIAQIAASLVLLVGAGLLVRALQNAVGTDPGYDLRGVWTATVDLDPHGYEAEDGRRLFAALTERVAGLPGVSSVAVGREVLLGHGSSTTGIRVPRAEGGEPVRRSVDFTVVDESYLGTLGIPLLAGRGFEASDVEGAPRVAIINEAMARSFWGGESPLGRTFALGEQEWTVVGVTSTGKYRSLDEDPLPFIHFPLSQWYSSRMALFVRTAPGAPDPLAGVRSELRGLDPDLPLLDAGTLQARIGVATFPHRVAAALTAVLGGIGLILAAIGVYGVMAFTVSQRTREIGIRLALGAGRGDVFALILRGALPIAAAGIAIGVVVALAAARAISGLLFGVRSTDPLTYVAVVLLLGLAALLATVLPAGRAARVEPVIALRAE